MGLYPIKQLKDKDKKPFFPFVILESVFVNGTDITLKQLLDNVYDKQEIDSKFENLDITFEIYPSVDTLPATAPDGTVVIIKNETKSQMLFFYQNTWNELVSSGGGVSTIYIASTEEPTDKNVLWIDSDDNTGLPDDTMSDTSTNTVQNKVVKQYIDNINAVTNDEINLLTEEISVTKQDIGNIKTEQTLQNKAIQKNVDDILTKIDQQTMENYVNEKVGQIEILLREV